MFLKHYLILLTIPIFFFTSCTDTQKPNETNKVKINKEELPNKITLLFVTQPHCPSCDRLEETMKLEKPSYFIENYFETKKIYLGEKLPDGLTPPNGTPTVYFLGYKDEILVEPMVGEKDEATLIMFLEDALYEFKNLYEVDLQVQKVDSNDTNIS